MKRSLVDLYLWWENSCMQFKCLNNVCQFILKENGVLFRQFNRLSYKNFFQPNFEEIFFFDFKLRFRYALQFTYSYFQSNFSPQFHHLFQVTIHLLNIKFYRIFLMLSISLDEEQREINRLRWNRKKAKEKKRKEEYRTKKWEHRPDQHQPFPLCPHRQQVHGFPPCPRKREKHRFTPLPRDTSPASASSNFHHRR